MLCRRVLSACLAPVRLADWLPLCCLQYWHETIAPVVKSGKNVIIAAHGNSLRALVSTALSGLLRHTLRDCLAARHVVELQAELAAARCNSLQALVAIKVGTSELGGAWSGRTGPAADTGSAANCTTASIHLLKSLCNTASTYLVNSPPAPESSSLPPL